LTAGNGPTGGSGSSLSLTGSVYGGAAGNVSVLAGNGGNGNPGGDVVFTAGQGTGSALGGSLALYGGTFPGVGGDVVLNGGSKNGGPSDGNIILANLRGKVGIGTTTPAANYLLDVKIGSSPYLVLGGDHMGFGDVNAGWAMRIGESTMSTYGSDLVLLATGPVSQAISFATVNAGTSAERMRIDSAGNVGIGTTAPTYTLHVVGTAGLSTGTAWTNASDIRLKDVHGDYEYGLNEILKLHTVRYSYKKDNPLGLPSDFLKTGFIAQEVKKVIPDAVSTRSDGFLELNVDPIHWAVVNAIKDLYRKYILPLWESDRAQSRAIASLKEENEKLRKEKDREINELKNRLQRIEKMLESKK
jgi:hypothetical protein